LAVTALLHGFSRLAEMTSDTPALNGGMRFVGSQDILSGRPLAAEVWVFFALWLGAGALLSLAAPTRAWRMTVGVTGAAALALIFLTLAPVWGTQLANAPTSTGAGYATICFALAAAAWFT